MLVANAISLDLLGGVIYWTTSHSIEMALLNGQQHSVIQMLPQFSSEIVLGLAMDYSSRRIYWLLYDTDTSSIFQLKMGRSLIGQNENNRIDTPSYIEKVSEFKSISM